MVLQNGRIDAVSRRSCIHLLPALLTRHMSDVTLHEQSPRALDLKRVSLTRILAVTSAVAAEAAFAAAWCRACSTAVQ